MSTENLTRASLLKVVEDNDGWKLVCRWCNKELHVPIPFRPTSEINNATGKRFLVKTKEQFMKNFLEMHYGLHMRQANPQWQPTKKRSSIRK